MKDSEVSSGTVNTLLLARRLVLSFVLTERGYFVQGALGTSEEWNPRLLCVCQFLVSLAQIPWGGHHLYLI